MSTATAPGRVTFHAISFSPAAIRNVLKGIEAIGYTVGPAVLGFNLFNFNLSKMGLFYRDPAQYGIASGIFLIALAWVIGNKFSK